MSILNYFPAGMSPRSEQSYILTEIERNWSATEVFCITAPTAVGKTAIGMTIGAWLEAKGKATNILVPTNILVSQMEHDYPDIAVLKRKDFYANDERHKTAKEVTRAAPVRAMNYHIYQYNKMFAYCMVADEGHKLLDILSDMRQVRIWAYKHKFPPGMTTVGEVLEWIETLDWQTDATLKKARQGILSIQDCAIVEYRTDQVKGNWDDVLDIVPITVRGFPPYLWPPKIVKKIILLSATINSKDLQELGLDTRKVTYIDADSPINPMNRQIRVAPTGRMSTKYLEGSCRDLAAHIRHLLGEHVDEKGLIHIPYSAANELKKHLSHPRIIWHTHDNKAETLKKFKESVMPVVMVASGMYEGVDLPYDKARWQIIAKVPYLNIGSPKVKAKLDQDPDWYDWEAIKRILQGCGRIVRATDDFGVTYITDSNFKELWRRDVDRTERMFPKYFREAVIFQG